MLRLCQRLTLVLLLSAAAAEAGVQIELRPEVVVMRHEYSLGDVAEVSATDSRIAQRLRDVELGRTPLPGQSVVVTRSAVDARLARVMPDVAIPARWTGPATTRVRGGGVERDGAAFAIAARQALLRWLRGELGDTVEIGIEPVGNPETLVTPTGTVEFEPRLSPAGQLRRRMSVWVDVVVDGRRVRTVPLWFAVTVIADVAVARADLATHDGVTTADYLFERRDIAALGSAPFFEQVPANHRTRRAVEAGQVLTTDTLEPIPDVQKGELVTVHARHGRVALAVKARALSDGQLDQQILVESLSSRDAFLVTVSGERQARVE